MLYYRYRKKERKYYEKDESGIRNKTRTKATTISIYRR